MRQRDSGDRAGEAASRKPWRPVPRHSSGLCSPRRHLGGLSTGREPQERKPDSGEVEVSGARRTSTAGMARVPSGLPPLSHGHMEAHTGKRSQAPGRDPGEAQAL